MLSAGLSVMRGRDEEVALVDGLVARLVSGRGAIGLVEGAPGIGKSRLLSEAVRRAEAAGAVVALGQVEPVEGVAPLAPLLSALGSGRDPVVSREELRALERPGDQRFWLLEELAEILERRSGQQPVLVVIDDAHWADEATAWAVGVLAPRLLPSPVGWLLAVRPGEMNPASVRLADTLVAAEAVRIELLPLALDDLDALCTDALGAPPGVELRELLPGAGGNPFLCLELIRALLGERAVEIIDGVARLVESTVPERFGARVRNRLAALSHEGHRFVQAASVLGRSFDLADVGLIVQAPAVHLADPLDEAVRADIVEDVDGRLRFRHDLLRQAILDGISPAVRGRLHREAADAVLARGGSPVDAAGHLLAYAEPGDQRAIQVLQEAAGAIAATAPGAAADLMVRAVELMEPGQPGWLDSVVGTVSLLAWATRFADAMALAERALARALDPPAEGRVRLGVSDAMLLTARRLDLIDHAREALARPDLPDGLRGHFLHNLANGLHQDGQIDASERAFQEALSLIDRADTSLVLSCRIGLNLVTGFRGHLAEGLEGFRHSVRACEEAGPEAQIRMPHLGRAALLGALDRFEEAEAALEESAAIATQLGAAWALEFAQKTRVAFCWDQGRLAEAATEAEADIAMADALDLWHDTDLSFGILGLAAFHANELEQAAAHVERAAAAGPRFAREASNRVQVVRAALLEADGRLDQAIAALGSLYDRSDALMAALAIQPDLAQRLVRLALRGGDRARANAVVATSGWLARANPTSASHGAVARQVLGLLDDDTAQLVAAAEAFRDSRRPLARASAYEDAGRALLASGLGGSGGSGGSADSDGSTAAVAWLDEACVGYREVGAARDEARVLRRLRMAGVRRTASSPVGAGGGTRVAGGAAAAPGARLTAAELRVVELAAAGLTNRQIAERLFLSPYTVGTHLKHVFTKLGVTSRVELARLAVEQQIVASPAPTSMS